MVGATNRPDMIDPAMCRPGRLDKLLYVDLPTAEERVEILRTLLRKTPLGPREKECVIHAVGTMILNSECDGFSGADLAAFVRESAVVALKRRLALARQIAATSLGAAAPVPNAPKIGPSIAEHASHTSAHGGEDLKQSMFVTIEDFAQALPRIVPSVSAQQRRRYNMLRRKFGNAGLPERENRPDSVEDSAQADGKKIAEQ